jgi:hypothetical protein
MRHYLLQQLLRVRPEAFVEAVQILNAHPDELVHVMNRYGYTDPPTIGGYLDRELPNPYIDAATRNGHEFSNSANRETRIRGLPPQTVR